MILVLCLKIDYQLCPFTQQCYSLSDASDKSTVEAFVLCCQLFAYIMSIFLSVVPYGQTEVHTHARNLTVRE